MKQQEKNLTLARRPQRNPSQGSGGGPKQTPPCTCSAKAHTSGPFLLTIPTPGNSASSLKATGASAFLLLIRRNDHVFDHQLGRSWSTGIMA